MSAATPNSHGLLTPTADELRACLARGVRTDFTTFWTRLCARGQVPATGPLTPRQLKELCDVLSAEGGLVGVLARGFAVRVSTYVALLDDPFDLTTELTTAVPPAAPLAATGARR